MSEEDRFLKDYRFFVEKFAEIIDDGRQNNRDARAYIYAMAENLETARKTYLSDKGEEQLKLLDLAIERAKKSV